MEVQKELEKVIIQGFNLKIIKKSHKYLDKESLEKLQELHDSGELEEFGKQLKFFLKQVGYSQQEFANVLSICRKTLNQVLNNKKNNSSSRQDLRQRIIESLTDSSKKPPS